MSDQDVLPGRIVVGIDGSAASVQALHWARFIASMAGADLTLVTAWQRPLSWSNTSPVMAPIEVEPARDVRLILENAMADVFGPQRPDSLHLLVRNGDAAHVLGEAADGAGMLVVGSRGHGAVADLILGSVSSTCVERASSPVLVVRADTPPPPA